MSKLYAMWVLWRNGYCTKHLVPKQRGMRGVGWCKLCNNEFMARKDQGIEKAKKRLGVEGTT